MNHLLRDIAPVTEAAWAELDQEARERLEPALAARKVVDFSGGHGWDHSATNLGRVQEAVARACARVGRSPDHVLLIAVSKTMDAERIRLAIEAGVAALGENRVQEAKEKISALGHPVPWHLIGTLQTNKARDAARLFDWIHSVDRLELARELSRRAGDRVLKVLLQVNLGDEPQKGGVAPAEVKRLAESVMGLPGLRVRGLIEEP